MQERRKQYETSILQAQQNCLPASSYSVPSFCSGQKSGAVIQREVPGIPEAMRAESMRITPRGCLSREAAGIRGDTLIINCPGSEKAAKECLTAVLPALKHGIQILRGWSGECSSHNGHEHKERHQNG